jgi:uncharacterized ferredoxin-like protein
MNNTKSKLKPDEIGQAILSALRTAPACRNVRDIIIVQLPKAEADAANWEIYDYLVDDFSHLSSECERLGADVQVRLQRQFDAIWSDDHS